jgi:tyrosyl-tRNA synthetase
MSDLFSELSWRGLVYDVTQGARDALARESLTAYVGFDPTAPGLHAGSLMQVMALARLQRAGHSPIAVVGGGTGMIGDPSGKTVERTLQSREVIEANVRGIRAELERFLDFQAPDNPARLVDNGEWLNSMSAMEFLRDVGKYFTVNYLLAKESVKRRLESEKAFRTRNSATRCCSVRLSGAARSLQLPAAGGRQRSVGEHRRGTDLIRKLRGTQTHGLVSPLLLTSSGTKFGKTEAGAVWLDAARTSPFRFYQFWFNADDRDVITYLKFFHLQIAGRDRGART